MDNIEQRLADVEELLRQIIKGRVRTDLLFHELEQSGFIPNGSNELADRLIDGFEKRFETQKAQEQINESKVIPLAFGRRLAEMREEIYENEHEIYELASQFRNWGRVNGWSPKRD